MSRSGDILRKEVARQRAKRGRGQLAKSELRKINHPHKVIEGGKVKVVDDDGHVYGTHDTEGEADQQLAALYAAKGRGE